MSLLSSLRTGSWLRRDRALLFAGATVAMAVLCTAWLLWTRHGTVDYLGRPIGTDFSDVWTAGWMATHGLAPDAWNWARHDVVQQALHHRADIPFYGWHYPPPFLLIAAPLAWMPYLPAYFLWQASTIALALLVAWWVLPRRDTLLFALGFPATYVCFGHGQNGFLTAALLGGGLLLLDRRPWLAGVLLGLLVYKPQFAPVLPVLLLAGRHWRAIGGAAASALAAIAATTAFWGTSVWQAFFASLALTRTVVIEGMNTGAYKVVSAFAALRLNGGGVALAYAVQGCVAIIAIAAVAVAARAAAPVRNAVVIAAALLATPYALDYDMVVLGLAIAWLVGEARATHWRAWDRTLLAFAYAAPLFGRQVAMTTGLPVNFVAIGCVWLVAVRRVPAALSSAAARRRSEHRHPAVDVDGLAGDVAGLATGKIRNRRANIRTLA